MSSNVINEYSPKIPSIPVWSSDIESSLNQMTSIRSILFNNIETFEDFCKIRSTITQIMYQYETNITLILKKIKDLSNNYTSLTSELSKSSVINGELDNKLVDSYQQLKELQYNNEILDSQVKYYKKQILEKDSYIFEWKSQLDSVDKFAAVNIGNSNRNKNEELNVSYMNFNNITLPERINRRRISEMADKSIKDIKSVKTENENENEKTDNDNNNDNNNQYELNYNYGYNYKENTETNWNNIYTEQRRNPGDISQENKTNSIPLSRKIQNIILNICKCDETTVEHLQNKFGIEILNRLAERKINDEDAIKIEKEMEYLQSKNINRTRSLKLDTQKYLGNQTSLKGWERWKGYLKMGKQDTANMIRKSNSKK